MTERSVIEQRTLALAGVAQAATAKGEGHTGGTGSGMLG